MKAMIVFHDDEHERPSGASRVERHAVRKAANEARRQAVLDRLDDANLAAEVALSDASPLSSVLIEGSEKALEVAKDTPCVKDVLPMSDDVGLELID
jgi:hypothetical protein